MDNLPAKKKQLDKSNLLCNSDPLPPGLLPPVSVTQGGSNAVPSLKEESAWEESAIIVNGNEQQR